jgi:hypothetical protein
MLIISKFHDYYDAVLKEGIDKTLVYKRDTSECIFNANPYRLEDVKVSPEVKELVHDVKHGLPHINRRDWRDDSFEANPFVIGFCGKAYVGYELRTEVWEYAGSKTIKEIVWDTDGIVAFMGKYKLESALDRFSDMRKPSKTFRRFTSYGNKQYKKFHVSEMDEVFNMFQNNPVLQGFFVKYHTPSFILLPYRYEYDVKLVVNPVLKDYDFIRVVDPYTAFQEVSMFLGGVLGVGAPETVTVSDKTKAIKHGMDNTSFRTPSPGKKFNRRNEK